MSMGKNFNFTFKAICIIIILFAFAPINSSAQYDNSNSYTRKVILQYDKDDKGFYHLSNKQFVNNVFSVEESYAYNKKTKKLYVMAFNGNYEIELKKDFAKIAKKDKMIPKLEGIELETAIDNINEELVARFDSINKRLFQIEDSIAAAKKKKEEEERKRREEAELQDYRKKHSWCLVPTNKVGIKCSLCDKYENSDFLYCLGIKNDSLYYATEEDVALGIQCFTIHITAITKELKAQEVFQRHIKAFNDSLTADIWHFTNHKDVKIVNELGMQEAFNKVKKKAPYGYFENWGWNDEYGSITFNFTYRNMNNKTIKYITVYWTVKNDVGDVRENGYFSGTGPLEYLDAATWDWDHSLYYVAGDATKMNITKVTITYMDGTKKTLTGRNILFN